MGVRSSLLTLADLIDPRQAYWTLLMQSGKVWSEHSLVGTWKAGQRGIRLLDWGEDIVTSGDVYRVKEIRLHCPDGRTAVLETTPDTPPFQFKTRSLDMIGAWDTSLEYIVIGRVIDKASGRCECFIWDYRPLPERPYKPAQLYIPAQPAHDDQPAIPEQPAMPEETYRPRGENLIAYKSSILRFGAWRDNITPLGALSEHVQGFRLA